MVFRDAAVLVSGSLDYDKSAVSKALEIAEESSKLYEILNGFEIPTIEADLYRRTVRREVQTRIDRNYRTNTVKTSKNEQKRFNVSEFEKMQLRYGFVFLENIGISGQNFGDTVEKLDQKYCGMKKKGVEKNYRLVQTEGDRKNGLLFALYVRFSKKLIIVDC